MIQVAPTKAMGPKTQFSAPLKNYSTNSRPKLSPRTPKLSGANHNTVELRRGSNHSSVPIAVKRPTTTFLSSFTHWRDHFHSTRLGPQIALKMSLPRPC